MKSTLDDLYFNGSLTALEECLKEFGQSVAGMFPLADGEMFGRIIGEIADDFDAAVNKRLLDIYAGNLLGGVRGVFGDTGYGSRYFGLANRLEANAARFAAYKAYHATEQVKRQLTARVSKEEALKRAEGALRAFNRYQAAEYNTAVARCRTAKQWIDFNREGHAVIFPNIRWLPSRSAERRPQHVPYYNRVWAKTDPFWLENQPGNEWNCKCDWEETADDVDHDGVKVTPPPAGLSGNPGITGEIFSEKSIYFTANGHDRVGRGILELGEGGFFGKGKIDAAEVLSHVLHEPGEIAGNMEVATLFCRHNKGVRRIKLLPNVVKEDAGLRPRFYPKGMTPRGANKNADAVIEWDNGDKWVVDFKCMQGNGAKLKERLCDAYEQADYAVVKICGEIKEVQKVIEVAERFMKGHNQFKGLIVYDKSDREIFRIIK